jgi:hypothetical protein
MGVRGIEGRIFHIRRLLKESLLDGDVSRGLALGITASCPRRDDRCELEAIWHFMHATAPDGYPNVRYTGDIDSADTFQTARKTLEYRGGDCDDGAILAPTLLAGNGFRVKNRIISNPSEPDDWAHIYPLVGYKKNNPTQWVPFDWVLGYHYFGTHPPQARFIEFDGHLLRQGREILPGEYRGWL